MAYHFIAISSYYSAGLRIGWHYSSDDILDKNIISDFLEASHKKLGKVEYGVHKLTTDSKKWSSVVEKDSFFADVLIIKNKEQFLEMLAHDKKVTVFDIAKFFLSVGSITNLKLQKLIYLAYATHLDRTGLKLFDEPIVAYKYGPVVEDLYDLYKSYGKDHIEDDDLELQLHDIPVPLSLAKIALSDDSKEIIDSLKITISKFWVKSASDLVTLTHTPGGPWDRVFQKEPYSGVITDNLIKQYHAVELKSIEKA